MSTETRESKIDVVDILSKHYPSIPAELDQRKIKLAIQEIVHAVIDKCNSKVLERKYPSGNSEWIMPYSDSIQQVKNEIKY